VTTLRALQTQANIIQVADIEYGAVNLGGGQSDRLDLVVQGRKGATVVEFKYPRAPRQTFPPWPDHLGSFFSDTYRLGSLMSGQQVRRSIQVLVSGAGFLGFLQRTTTRLGLGQYKNGDRTPSRLTLTPASMAGLSTTTRRKVKRYEESWEIDAVRTVAHDIASKGLWLAAYDVQSKTRDRVTT
jgi:hypothetical protein